MLPGCRWSCDITPPGPLQMLHDSSSDEALAVLELDL